MHASKLTSLFTIFALLCLAAAFSPAQTPATVKQYETEPHVGTAEEALVGIIVTNHAEDGTTQVRHGNGIFIRCDGFVMAPEALFGLNNTAAGKVGKPNQAVVVVLNPGTDHEKRLPAARPRDFGVVSVGDRFLRIGYAVFKLDDIHHAAPRLLAPDALAPGAALQIVSSRWNDEANRFLPIQTVSAAAGAKHAVDAAGKPLLPSAATKFAAETSRFAQPVHAEQDGAIVVGPDKMVVGMVTEPGAAVAGFANLGSLDQVTNCVGLEPCTDAQFAEMVAQAEKAEDPANKLPADAQRPKSEMVPVKGGPVKVPTVVQGYDADLENVYDACVGPFEIDKYEVTNAQYLQFWKLLPESVRKDAYSRSIIYPYGWGDEQRPFPDELAEVPVLGVRLAGAKAYAKWVGKRLPTPCEWCLAAFGRYGGNRPPDWADRYMSARATAWQSIIDAHIQYAHQHPEIIPGFSVWTDITGATTVDPDMTRPVAEEFCQLPWFFVRPGFAQAAAWSHDCVKRLTEPLFREWVDPGYILPVGSRPYDISPCGAMDMIMNARELVLPGPHGLWKKRPNTAWPYADVDRYMEVDWVQGGLITFPWYRLGNGGFDFGIPKSSDSPIMVGGTEALVNIDAYLKTTQMYNTNLLISHPAHNEPGSVARIIINPGAPAAGLTYPIISQDTPVPAEWDSKLLDLYHPVSSYEFRMPSRRIASASQNEGAGFAGFVPADLGEYVNVCAAVQEYSEQLRPVNTTMLNLVPGPTFQVPYWASAGTWGYGSTFQITGPGQARRVGKTIIRGASITDLGLNEWTADATCISMAGAYASWSGGPDHYHTEMGRRTAIDAYYPINSRPVNQPGAGGFAPDTFLIPGGFRCAR